MSFTFLTRSGKTPSGRIIIATRAFAPTQTLGLNIHRDSMIFRNRLERYVMRWHFRPDIDSWNGIEDEVKPFESTTREESLNTVMFETFLECQSSAITASASAHRPYFTYSPGGSFRTFELRAGVVRKVERGIIHSKTLLKPFHLFSARMIFRGSAENIKSGAHTKSL